MHECIRKLLVQTDEESLECLCKLTATVGQVRYIIICKSNLTVVFKILEQETGFSNMDSYFASMDKLVAEKKTSSRLRFLMQVRIGFIGKFKWIYLQLATGP